MLLTSGQLSRTSAWKTTKYCKQTVQRMSSSSHPSGYKNQKGKKSMTVRCNKISLITVDEAHLVHLWPQFRNSYKELENLKSDFPLVALTPFDVEQSIQKLLREPLIIRESVNRPNIFLSCEELPYFGEKGLSKRVSEIQLLYTQTSLMTIVSELAEYDIDCVAYGEMDVQSRHTSYNKWRNGEVRVMGYGGDNCLRLEKTLILEMLYGMESQKI